MRRSRGSILLAVMVVVSLAALVGVTLIVSAESGRAGARVQLERDQLRALAESGLEGILAQFDAQRGDLLEGGAPRLVPEWTLWERGGQRGVIRLSDPFPSSEAARLDLNHADESMLAALPGADAAVAGAVVSRRGSAPFPTPESIVLLPGVTPAWLDGAPRSDDGAARFLTTFAFEPQTVVGVGKKAADRKGQLRAEIHGPWSPELDARFGAMLSPGALAVIHAALDGREVSTPAELSKACQASPEIWGELLDVLCVNADPYTAGRVDLTRAPAEVLACIPGFDAESAQKAVHQRDALGTEALRNVAWPLQEKILSPENFAKAAPWLTTRSLVWRVRWRGEIEPADSGAPDAAPSSPARRIEWEAVIDATDARARVASLRDVTYLALGRLRASRPPPDSGGADPPSQVESDAPETPPLPESAGEKGGNLPTEGLGNGNNPLESTPPARDDRLGRWKG